MEGILVVGKIFLARAVSLLLLCVKQIENTMLSVDMDSSWFLMMVSKQYGPALLSLN